MTDAPIRVVVVDTRTITLRVHTVALPGDSTVRDALAAAGLLAQQTGAHGRATGDAARAGGLDVGIFGRRCPLDTALRDGDRVELYRTLDMDPKEARRRRAAARAQAAAIIDPAAPRRPARD